MGDTKLLTQPCLVQVRVIVFLGPQAHPDLKIGYLEITQREEVESPRRDSVRSKYVSTAATGQQALGGGRRLRNTSLRTPSFGRKATR